MFRAGNANTSFSVDIYDDTKPESNETFELHINRSYLLTTYSFLNVIIDEYETSIIIMDDDSK